MGNRSRYVAVAAAAGTAALVSRRRRARLRLAMEGVRETIMPSHVTDLPSERAPRPGDGHAPGHQHLPMAPDQEPPTIGGRRRPWAPSANAWRHRA